jgi:hypothetical protein
MRRGPQYAWWNLHPGLKRILQAQRLSGKYGGESAAAIGKAPYFWAQEYGKASAAILPQHFATDSWGAFQARQQDILRQSVRDSLAG